MTANLAREGSRLAPAPYSTLPRSQSKPVAFGHMGNLSGTRHTGNAPANSASEAATTRMQLENRSPGRVPLKFLFFLLGCAGCCDLVPLAESRQVDRVPGTGQNRLTRSGQWCVSRSWPERSGTLAASLTLPSQANVFQWPGIERLDRLDRARCFTPSLSPEFGPV